MSVKRLPAIRTPSTPETMFYALGYAWVQLFDTQPKSSSLCCLLSQWALETAWGKSCWCWNIGNFKSRDGDLRNYTYYECDERFDDPKVAQKYIDGAGVRIDGSGLPNAAFKSVNKDGTTTVYFWPDHPVSRFRAYETLQDGAVDYVNSLFNRFYKAWPAVLKGDPVEFVHQLKVQKYFTADEATYTKTTQSLHKTFSKIPFDMNKLPILSDAHAEEIQGLIALTLSETVRGTYRDLDDEEESEKNV